MEEVEIKTSDSTGKDEFWGHWFDCPKCKYHNVMPFVNYCANCGVKIRWVEDIAL